MPCCVALRNYLVQIATCKWWSVQCVLRRCNPIVSKFVAEPDHDLSNFIDLTSMRHNAMDSFLSRHISELVGCRLSSVSVDIFLLFIIKVVSLVFLNALPFPWWRQLSSFRRYGIFIASLSTINGLGNTLTILNGASSGASVRCRTHFPARLPQRL